MDFDFDIELSNLYKIFFDAQKYTYEIMNNGDINFKISRKCEKEFDEKDKKLNEKLKLLREKNKKNKNMHFNYDDDLTNIENNFIKIKKDFFEFCDRLWHELIENDHNKLEKQVQDVIKLEEKYEGITKEFLTAMALFITLFSVITTNVSIFYKCPTAYLVLIVNITVLIALTTIFLFVYMLFNKGKTWIFLTIIGILFLILFGVLWLENCGKIEWPNLCDSSCNSSSN